MHFHFLDFFKHILFNFTYLSILIQFYQTATDYHQRQNRVQITQRELKTCFHSCSSELSLREGKTMLWWQHLKVLLLKGYRQRNYSLPVVISVYF